MWTNGLLCLNAQPQLFIILAVIIVVALHEAAAENYCAGHTVTFQIQTKKGFVAHVDLYYSV